MATSSDIDKQMNADIMATPDNTVAAESRRAQIRRNIFGAILHWLYLAGCIVCDRESGAVRHPQHPIPLRRRIFRPAW
ncbi:hypothetical protein DL767_010458 [Monosporascus sp. MG133]|nr:hypothetical protein DL767_010458 [Monosporascus sp. MG133]